MLSDGIRNQIKIGENIFRLICKDGRVIDNPEINGLQVIFQGRMGGTVEIEEDAVFHNTKIYAGGAGFIRINKTHPKGIKNVTIKTVCPCPYKYLLIDEGCSIEQAVFMLVNDEDLVVKIGKDCMLSSGIFFRAADGHTIFDVNTKNVMNYSSPIIIGDHVWIGANSTFLKGAEVASNSIVGTHSLVTKKFSKQFCAIAGIPANVVREGINWDRLRITEYKQHLSVK
ncbi:acyltransferase [Actinobacillus pleuropneumoniae]|uniref:Capsular polysaccharide biosynthesis protein Cps16E n=1 Tax=Actinobacillus pleuropneumoniae TaxID=715 RepID=A0A1P8J7R8_ACTPL|nr:DapH/DapD/GlmU-related protein [Actinobacillus pleuropneumoniae]APW29090.1 capsular polysaccharide biosynthesis protein Cps16E [Actinobacillus pleuropneumoniae]AVY03750.1 capsular polysaccharide biosynthesis protein Cps16E [Actinobacillus pleuropneumoniae]UKH20695.1 acyltransferase [Actinobacillus pleuropneumoniae]UPA20440.1 hypothetical protein JS559_08905 [Actinobacillus pleuropneumoniae]